MARTAITVTTLDPDSAENAAAVGVYQAGDNVNGMVIPASSAPKSGRLLLHAKNTNAAARTVTLKAGSGGDVGPAWRAGLGDLAITVAATTGEQMILVTDTARFRQSNGDLNIDISGTNVTIAAFYLPFA